MKLDFLIVGAGPFGTTFARVATDAGLKVMIVERRTHIAGNCFDERRDGINVHKYGPHIFHTSNKTVWDFVNRFSAWRPYEHRVKAIHSGRVFSMPINLHTLHMVWGVTSPKEAQEKLAQVAVPCANPRNLEEWIRAQVGDEIYEMCVKGYTEKQWGRPCKDLPASIIKRLPIRLTFDDRYHGCEFQGLPADGYTPLFRNMLGDIPYELGVDYLQHREKFDAMADRVLFTGPIDKFYDHQFGDLEYRTLRFETERTEDGGTGCPQLNFTEASVPYTRIMDWKHFERLNVPHSIITREYPTPCTKESEPYYTIRDEANNGRYAKYAALAKSQKKYIFGGRLGSYAYLDMDMAIASSLSLSKRLCGLDKGGDSSDAPALAGVV